MNAVYTIVQLLLEVLYYSLFSRFSKNKGSMVNYILTFLVITTVIILLQNIKMIAYLSFVIIALLSFKYFVKCETSMYDALMIFAMLIYKLIIELIFTFVIYIFIKNVYIVSIIVCCIKVASVFLIKYKLRDYYSKFEKYWNNNNFYIRYTTSTLMIMYVICASVFLIKYWL